MLSFVTVANAHISLEPEPQQQGTQQMAMIINRPLHAGNNTMKPLMTSGSVNFLLLEPN